MRPVLAYCTLFILAVGISACGNGELVKAISNQPGNSSGDSSGSNPDSTAGDATNAQPTASASDPLKAPMITAVTSDGSSASTVGGSLIVAGKNFGDKMTVDLTAIDSTANYSLDYGYDATAQTITAPLPKEIKAGKYEVTITTKAGTATSPITLLQGAPGPAGPTGPAGLTIDYEYSCIFPLSVDLDSSSTNRHPEDVQVTRFTDGSYFVSCAVSYLSPVLGYDTSSDSSWIAHDSRGVAIDVVPCNPFHITFLFKPSDHSVTAVSQADSSQKYSMTCDQVYP